MSIELLGRVSDDLRLEGRGEVGDHLGERLAGRGLLALRDRRGDLSGSYCLCSLVSEDVEEGEDRVRYRWILLEWSDGCVHIRILLDGNVLENLALEELSRLGD